MLIKYILTEPKTELDIPQCSHFGPFTLYIMTKKKNDKGNLEIVAKMKFPKTNIIKTKL